MIACGDCQKLNTLDSQFCRACGHALPADTLDEARQANEQLVTEGIKFLSEGRYDEALLAAEKALEEDPQHLQALSLRGDALERTGDLAGALHCYERVVELTPASALDRIKLEHVRRMLSAQADVPAPDKKRPVLAAVAATVMVAALGTAGMLYWQSRNTSPASATTVAAQENAPPPATGAMADQPIPQAREVSRAEFERLRAEAEANARAQTPATTPSAAPAPAPAGGNTNGRLPNASANGGNTPLEGEVRPMTPPLTITPINPPVQQQPSSPPPAQSRPAPTNSVDPDPQPVSQSGTPSRPARNPGVVDIRPSADGPERTGGSQVVPENAGSSARELLQRGRQFFSASDYAKAADAFERALAAGADPGSTNQRLAQCYERLGRKADAIRAYSRAEEVFAARVQANPNNEAARAALDATRQALAGLRG